MSESLSMRGGGRVATAFTAIVVLGLVMSAVQVTLLREALSASSGSELAVGLGLTIWLLAVAAGAGVGAALPARIARSGLAVAALLAAAAPFASLLVARSALQIFRASPGELLTIGQQLAGHALSFGPVCLAIGATFTLACRLPELSPRLVYLAEALGWLLGGIAATWGLVMLSPFMIVSLLAFLTLAAAGLLWRPGWPIAATGVAILLIAWLVRIPWTLETRTLARRWPEQRIVGSAYTPHGQGALLERAGQTALYENGRLSLVLAETESSEALAHLAMLQVDAPRRVFLVGGLGGLLPEVLKYPVREVVVAEYDCGLARLALSAAERATRDALRDPRVRIVYGDGRRLLRTLAHEVPRTVGERGGAAWDVVILNLPPPGTALINRFYTAEFFREARRALRPDGVLVFALPGADGFYSTELIARNGTVYRALRAAFPRVAVTPLATNYYLATAQGDLCLDWQELGRRLAARRISPQIVNEYYYAGIFHERQSEELARQYRDRAIAINRDLTPAAYLQELTFEQQMESGALARLIGRVAAWNPWITGMLALSLALFCGVLPSSPWRRGGVRRGAVLFAVAALGFAGMALTLLFLLLAQIALGALYHLLGVIVALGMAGMALGAWTVSRLPVRHVALPLLLAALLALALPAFAPAATAWPFTASLLMLGAFALLAGAAVGAMFPLAVESGASPAAAYTADLLGAASAGLLTAIILIPAHGLLATCLTVAVLLGLALAAVALIVRGAPGR